MPVPSIPGFQAVSQNCLTLISNLNPLASRFSLNWRDSDAIAGAVSIVNRAVGALFDKSYIACGAFVALGALSLYNGYRVHYFKEKNQQLENDKLDMQLKITEFTRQKNEFRQTNLKQKPNEESLLKLSNAQQDALDNLLGTLDFCHVELTLEIEKLKKENHDLQQWIQSQKKSLEELRESEKNKFETLHSNTEQIEQNKLQSPKKNEVFESLMEMARDIHVKIDKESTMKG